jgi:hypothetical protein
MARERGSTLNTTEDPTLMTTQHLVRTELPTISIDVDRRSRRFTLNTLSPDGVNRVGTFANVADVWAAVDALDTGLVPVS